jgi:hypothetical protein
MTQQRKATQTDLEHLNRRVNDIQSEAVAKIFELIKNGRDNGVMLNEFVVHFQVDTCIDTDNGDKEQFAQQIAANSASGIQPLSAGIVLLNRALDVIEQKASDEDSMRSLKHLVDALDVSTPRTIDVFKRAIDLGHRLSEHIGFIEEILANKPDEATH